MTYVDGFLIPVPAARKADYKALAERVAPIFKEYGAERVVECWADDVSHGKLTDFYRAVAAEDGETIVFSWIVYPSKAVRDEANAKVMADRRMKMEGDMVFNPQRMIMGGFEQILDL